METITIGSKLPAAIVLEHPLAVGLKVTIKGLNGAPRGMDDRPIQVPYMTTEVDAEFWESWKLLHSGQGKVFPPLACGALFEAKSENDAKAIAREQEKRKTGLEPMKKNAGGVKPATTKD